MHTTLESMYVFAYCMYGIGFRLLRRPSINFGDAELKRDYSGRTNGTETIHLTTKNPTPHHAQPVSMVCIPARVVLYCDSQYAQYIHIMHTRVRMHTSYERRSLVLASNVKYMHTTSYAYYQLEQYAYQLEQYQECAYYAYYYYLLEVCIEIYYALVY